MCRISAEELYERMKDRYTVPEIVDLLEMTYDDLEGLGITHFLVANMDSLTTILEDMGVLDDLC